MPTWGELLQDLNQLRAERQEKREQGTLDPSEPAPVDLLRRKYLNRLHSLTGRAVIIYETAWIASRPEITAADVSVGQVDVQGFMEAVSNIKTRELDLIIHSPGGSAEAAESVMEYLRDRFDHIRAVVPHAAMSAATMMALACDEVIMGSHSQLGPVDPQFTIPTPDGPRTAPAQLILDQFERAKRECQDPKNVPAWIPIIRGTYIPGLLSVCESQLALAEEFVAKSLAEHMLADEENAEEKAQAAAQWFADHEQFRSHSRRVGRNQARANGIKVQDLEDQQELQDAVLSVHHAVDHLFNATGAFKLIENHLGRAFMQNKQQINVVAAPVQPGGGGAGGDRAVSAHARRSNGVAIAASGASASKQRPGAADP